MSILNMTKKVALSFSVLIGSATMAHAGNQAWDLMMTAADGQFSQVLFPNKHLCNEGKSFALYSETMEQIEKDHQQAQTYINNNPPFVIGDPRPQQLCGDGNDLSGEVFRRGNGKGIAVILKGCKMAQPLDPSIFNLDNTAISPSHRYWIQTDPVGRQFYRTSKAIKVAACVPEE